MSKVRGDFLNSQLSDRINQGMKKFSKCQRRIASYILEHYGEVAFMTASQLGNTVGVSESTVVRFAVELGYTGYPSMQRAIQEMIKRKLTSVQRLELVRTDRYAQDILSGVLTQDMDTIKRTMEELNRKAFEQAVQAVSSARKVYIMGARSSSALATFLFYHLRLILEDVHLLSASSEEELYEQLIRVGVEDAVFAISFPRYSRKIVKAVHYARRVGANVVALTDSESAPIAGAASELLIAKSGMISFVDSLIAPMSVINAFIAAVAESRRNEVRELFKKLEFIWDEYGVYEKVDEK